MDIFRRDEASEHYERAIALERAGRLDEAIAEYRRAVSADPGFADAHLALGHHYRQRGLLTKAVDAFQTVSRLEPSMPHLFNLGYALVELGRYPEALEVFQQCLGWAPEDPTVLYEIGYTYYASGRLSEALDTLQVPLQIYVEDWQVHALVAACHLGLANWREAETHYRRALKQASSPEEIAEIQASLGRAQRYQEFSPDDAMGIKEQLYADSGVALLGTAGDDGLHICLRHDETISLKAVATTLRRLHRLVQALGISLNAVVALDRVSLPLAVAWERLSSVPRRRLAQLGPGDRPLLVLLRSRQPEFLQVASEQAPEGALSFIMALDRPELDLARPDFVGVPVAGTCPLPWTEDRLEHEGGLATIDALMATYAQLPPEPTRGLQVQYYAQEHCRLRFLAG